MYQTQIKHKAQHGGYRQKPSNKEVNALLGLYEGISKAVLYPINKPQPKVGEQLKLNF